MSDVAEAILPVAAGRRSKVSANRSDVAEFGRLDLGFGQGRGIERRQILGRKRAQLSFRLGTAVTNFPPQPVI